MVLGPFVSVGGLMGVGRSKTGPHPRALRLATPWLAHSISPHPQKSLGSRVRGSDRELGGPVWGLRVGASSLWLYSLGYSKTQGQLRHKGRENRPDLLMRGVSEQNWTGQGCRDASNSGQFCPCFFTLFISSLTFQMGSLKGAPHSAKHTAGWQRPRCKEQGQRAGLSSGTCPRTDMLTLDYHLGRK